MYLFVFTKNNARISSNNARSPAKFYTEHESSTAPHPNPAPAVVSSRMRTQHLVTHVFSEEFSARKV